ncbi:hypothetical protein JIX59_16020 [Brevundimonas diminuta]|jgi:hypothetical protein|uniref:hypothetical protein n=2 Tax=Caulobacteraceae TaxID=76892 RepID=UPI0019083156|nr:hypothetical protein [Brevundimonas diminuta]MBK1970849.1 hypothetical protein [Brevundimonas diminuta]MDA1322570.1 hypothetical protein [Pseudomonadota bacterium]
MSRFSIAAMAVVLGGAGLSACAQKVEAPADKGVCYHVGDADDGGALFNVVARDQPQIEFCAARLEEMRLRFLRMGGSKTELVGAYQGQFIFIDRAGVKFGKSLDGPRFFALARTGDGRLAIPGAIQRQMDGRPIAVAPN